MSAPALSSQPKLGLFPLTNLKNLVFLFKENLGRGIVLSRESFHQAVKPPEDSHPQRTGISVLFSGLGKCCQKQRSPNLCRNPKVWRVLILATPGCKWSWKILPIYAYPFDDGDACIQPGHIRISYCLFSKPQLKQRIHVTVIGFTVYQVYSK